MSFPEQVAQLKEQLNDVIFEYESKIQKYCRKILSLETRVTQLEGELDELRKSAK